MKEKKKHKFLLISPSGKEYLIGFLSPCKNGFVLGASQIKKGESSHLTILRQKGTISAHITSQKPSKERRYFLPFSVKEFAARFKSLLDNNMAFRLSQEQLSEDVMYVTKSFEDWYNALIKALYQKKTTKKEIIHTLNFKNLLEQIPKLADELKRSPQSFFGLCKAKDMLRDSSRIAGISRSKALIIPTEKELIGVDFGIFASFDFAPCMTQSQINSPLTEFYQSLGIPQYLKQEVIDRKFLEGMLSKENWQAPKLDG